MSSSLLSCLVCLSVLFFSSYSGAEKRQDTFEAWYRKNGTWLDFVQHSDDNTLTEEFYRQFTDYSISRLKNARSLHYLELGCGYGGSAKLASRLYQKATVVERHKMQECKAGVTKEGSNGNVHFLELNLYEQDSWRIIQAAGPYDVVMISASHEEKNVFSDIMNIIDMASETVPKSENTKPMKVFLPDYGNSRSRGTPGRRDPGARESIDFFRSEGILTSCEGIGFYYGYEEVDTKQYSTIDTLNKIAELGSKVNFRYAEEMKNGYVDGMSVWVEGWEALVCDLRVEGVTKEMLHSYRHKHISISGKPVSYILWQQPGSFMNINFHSSMEQQQVLKQQIVNAFNKGAVKGDPMLANQMLESQIMQLHMDGPLHLLWDGNIDEGKRQEAESRGFQYVFDFLQNLSERGSNDQTQNDLQQDSIELVLMDDQTKVVRKRKLGCIWHPKLFHLNLFDFETGEYWASGMNFREFSFTIDRMMA